MTRDLAGRIWSYDRKRRRWESGDAVVIVHDDDKGNRRYVPAHAVGYARYVLLEAACEAEASSLAKPPPPDKAPWITLGLAGLCLALLLIGGVWWLS